MGHPESKLNQKEGEIRKKMDEYQQSWEEFQATMIILRQRQSEILMRISQGIDEQKAALILKKLKINEKRTN